MHEGNSCLLFQIYMFKMYETINIYDRFSFIIQQYWTGYVKCFMNKSWIAMPASYWCLYLSVSYAFLHFYSQRNTPLKDIKILRHESIIFIIQFILCLENPWKLKVIVYLRCLLWSFTVGYINDKYFSAVKAWIIFQFSKSYSKRNDRTTSRIIYIDICISF